MSRKQLIILTGLFVGFLGLGVIAETILEQPTIPGTSLDIDDLSSVYAIVDDDTVSPAVTNKVPLKTLRDLDKYEITTAAPVALTGNEPNHIFVDVTNASHVVTVPDGMTCILYNVSVTGVTLEVDVTGAANQFVFPGDYLLVYWDADAGPPAHVPKRSYVLNSLTGGTTLPVTDAAIKTYVDLNDVTLDASVNTGSTNGVQNGAITTYVNNRNYIQPGDVIVEDVNDDGAEQAAFVSAVSTLNSQQYGTLWIRGEVTISTAHRFEYPISLRGMNSRAAIKIANGSTYLTWGVPGYGSGSGAWSPLTDGSSVAFTAADRGDTTITSPNLALVPGDFVLLHSSDPVDDVDPHNPFTAQLPWEIHEIIDDARGSNIYDLGTPVIDDLQTSPLIIKVPFLDGPEADNTSNITVSDLTFRQYADNGGAVAIYFANINGLRFQNIVWDTVSGVSGPGQVQFNMCANVLVDNVIQRGQENYNENAKSQYFLQFMTGLNYTVSNCIFQKSRHSIDTSALDDGTNRFGGPVNLVVDHCTFQRTGNAETAISNSGIFSTHPEAWGTTIQNCVFICGDEQPASSGQTQQMVVSRGRFFRALNCTFIGPNMSSPDSNSAIGIYLDGFDQEVAYCNFTNQWNAIRINNITPYTGTQGARYHIHHNHFRDATNAGEGQIYIYEGTDIKIAHNTFINNENAAIAVSTSAAGGDVDGVWVIGNAFMSTPNAGSGEPTIFMEDASQISDNWLIQGNTFTACPNTIVKDSGTGAGHYFVGNTIIQCGGTDLIEIAGTSGSTWVIRNNDLSKASTNTNSFDIGSADAADITISGNTCMGYGAGSLGLTGTNAAAVNAAQAGDNWTD